MSDSEGVYKLLSRISKKYEPKTRQKRVPEDTPEIREIKQAIPLILNLDRSWNCPEHVGWQILRLNQTYRDSVKRFYQHKYGPDRLFDQSFKSYPFFVDYPPDDPQETFQDYERKVTVYVEDNIRHGTGLFRGNKIDKNDLVPYSIRFPCPLIRPLLPTHKFPSLMSGRGNKPKNNWLRNLLVYELSQAGAKDAEIGRLIFGVERSRLGRGDPKHPVLVRIAKIKKSMEKVVSKCDLSI